MFDEAFLSFLGDFCCLSAAICNEFVPPRPLQGWLTSIPSIRFRSLIQPTVSLLAAIGRIFIRNSSPISINVAWSNDRRNVDVFGPPEMKT